jgi:hypothetical protein
MNKLRKLLKTNNYLPLFRMSLLTIQVKAETHVPSLFKKDKESAAYAKRKLGTTRGRALTKMRY